MNLRKLFERWDTDKDGHLDYEEFGVFIRKLLPTVKFESEVSYILGQIDMDKNGTIEMEDFISFVKKPPKKNSKFRVSKDELAKKKRKALLKRRRQELVRKRRARLNGGNIGGEDQTVEVDINADLIPADMFKGLEKTYTRRTKMATINTIADEMGITIEETEPKISYDTINAQTPRDAERNFHAAHIGRAGRRLAVERMSGRTPASSPAKRRAQMDDRRHDRGVLVPKSPLARAYSTEIIEPSSNSGSIMAQEVEKPIEKPDINLVTKNVQGSTYHIYEYGVRGYPSDPEDDGWLTSEDDEDQKDELYGGRDWDSGLFSMPSPMKIKQQDDIYREVDVQWDELNVYDKYGSPAPEARMQGLTIDTNHTIPEMTRDGMLSMGMGMGMMISGEQGGIPNKSMLVQTTILLMPRRTKRLGRTSNLQSFHCSLHLWDLKRRLLMTMLVEGAEDGRKARKNPKIVKFWDSSRMES